MLFVIGSQDSEHFSFVHADPPIFSERNTTTLVCVTKTVDIYGNNCKWLGPNGQNITGEIGVPDSVKTSGNKSGLSEINTPGRQTCWLELKSINISSDIGSWRCHVTDLITELIIQSDTVYIGRE
jgi:hypothetical protein